MLAKYKRTPHALSVTSLMDENDLMGGVKIFTTIHLLEDAFQCFQIGPIQNRVDSPFKSDSTLMDILLYHFCALIYF